MQRPPQGCHLSCTATMQFDVRLTHCLRVTYWVSSLCTPDNAQLATVRVTARPCCNTWIHCRCARQPPETKISIWFSLLLVSYYSTCWGPSGGATDILLAVTVLEVVSHAAHLCTREKMSMMRCRSGQQQQIDKVRCSGLSSIFKAQMARAQQHGLCMMHW